MALPEQPVVWICPNCGSYYASSSIGDLREEWNTEKNSTKPTFQRSRCPAPVCSARNIQREPFTFKVLKV